MTSGKQSAWLGLTPTLEPGVWTSGAENSNMLIIGEQVPPFELLWTHTQKKWIYVFLAYFSLLWSFKLNLKITVTNSVRSKWGWKAVTPWDLFSSFTMNEQKVLMFCFIGSYNLGCFCYSVFSREWRLNLKYADVNVFMSDPGRSEFYRVSYK